MMPKPKTVLKALARLEPMEHNRVMKEAVQAADSSEVEDLVEMVSGWRRVRGLGPVVLRLQRYG
jgi:hypothetical protein